MTQKNVLHVRKAGPYFFDMTRTLCGITLPFTPKSEADSETTRCPSCAAKLEAAWNRGIIEKHQ
ncbi:hypothetical protein [Bifidobacterium dentium]|uniref:hypothetical protein n=1 Tax=Bifidobacterium dentium TaxID=1689 RepID=UPI000E9A9914|nr:hypothetical protein [Bifidobacterium dentium]MCK6132258.1 hypothetical protein [Bifidobacterium dentium]QTL78149.1 hypothetical protein J7M35_01765 [Bifidobacterium dentium]HBJ52652.1 hypothetical protein [Bifidobacterium dentium]